MKSSMFKVLSLTLIVVFAFIGCDQVSSPVAEDDSFVDGKSGRELDAWSAEDITYSITFEGSSYDAENDETTFEYTVISNPDGGPAISHWVIEFPEGCGDADILAGSNDNLVEWNESDPTTGVRGIKFDTGYDDQEIRTVTLTLYGEWSSGDAGIAVKSANAFVLGSTTGPVCGDGGTDPEDPTDPETDPVYNIDGIVFYDLNENGIQDAGEPGIEGVDVTLSTGYIVYTDANGYYVFEELLAGDYNVTVGEHNNRDHTTPASVDVTIVDADVTVNFGFAGYHVTGTVFLDIDGDGFQDADEAGIPGIEVTLSDGSVLYTDDNGNYDFDQLLPGDYGVTVEDIDGFNATTPTYNEVSITVDDVEVNFGFEIDFEGAICGATADGFTIGFWKNNINKAIQGKTKGIQVDAATLEAYVNELSDFALYPLNFGSLQDAYSVLSANGSDEVLLLSKQLAGSEFNFANGAFINGNELLTWAFVYWGEYVIAHSSDFSGAEILEAKDWFDAYNNSHGGQFFGPGCSE